MKLISLNIWGGRVHDPLLQFIETNGKDVDIFCFQEVYRTATDKRMAGDAYANIYGEIAAILPDHQGHFTAGEHNWAESGTTDFQLEFGLAMFVRSSLEKKSNDHLFVHKHLGAQRSEIGYSAARPLQYVTIQCGSRELTVANFHGLHNGLGKEDSDERLAQAQKVKEFLDQAPGETILCGDFNLLPDTESMKIMEAGMRNLIIENGITSTRSSIYKKESKFADYMLVSSGIHVIDFKVLPDEVSDHLPLVLEFERG